MSEDLLKADVEPQEPADGQSAAPMDGGDKTPPDGGADGGTGQGRDEAGSSDKDAGGVPEEYEKFSLPEGFEYDEAAAKDFEGLARELGLSQEQAQRLVNMYTDNIQRGILAQAEAADARNAAWADAARTDAEYGGSDFEKNLAIANYGLSRLGSPALMKYLSESGLGNHPEIIRLCWKAGKLMREDAQPEDQAPRRGGAAMSEAELAKKMFASEKE